MMDIEDGRFDRHIRLVANIFGMPTVAVSFVDADGQWFKSGLDSELSQTAHEESFCSEAFRLGYLEIPDTFLNVFFHDHPAVRGERPVRFYAGAVLYGTTGQPIGTLCMNDRIPRKLSTNERSLLEDFAALVQHEIHQDAARIKDRPRLHYSGL